MSIQITCSQGHTLQVPESRAGTDVRCPRCQETVSVPATASSDETMPYTPRDPRRVSDREYSEPKSRGAVALIVGGLVVLVLVGGAIGAYFAFRSKDPVVDNTPNAARDREAIRDVAQQFIDASKSEGGNPEALFTDKAREGMKGGELKRGKQRPGQTFSIGEPTIDGDRARVVVTGREAGKDEPATLLMRRQGTDWRIYGISVRLDPGNPESELVMDFEEPEKMFGGLFGGIKDMGKNMERDFNAGIEDSMSGKARDQDRANEAIKPLDRAAFDGGWKGSLDIKNGPAGDVLNEMAKEFSLELKPTPAQKQALARPISIQKAGLSLYERLDLVSKPAGFYPKLVETYGGSGPQTAIELKQLPRPFPVAFAGPFIVEIEELSEYVPHAAGQIALRVQATSLPPVVLDLMDSQSPLTVLEVQDGKGRELRDLSTTANRGRMFRVLKNGYDRTFDVNLKGLLRDVTAIKTLKGKLTVTLPVKVEEARFEALANNAIRKAGDIELKLKQVNKSTMTFNDKKIPQTTFAIDIKGLSPKYMKVIAYDSEKKLMGLSSSGHSFIGDQGNASYSVSGEPASLLVKILRTEDVEYEFRFDDVPLTKASEMPEKLTPASFEGPTPVSVEFVRITKDFLSKAQVRITNHSDKPIRTVTLGLVYFDAAGKEIGKWGHLDHEAQAKLNSKELPIVVGAKATVVTDIQAPFAPDNTKNVKITPKRVLFADLSRWEAPAKK